MSLKFVSASLEGGRLTRVVQRCWPRAEPGQPGHPVILQHSRGVDRRHTGIFEFELRWSWVSFFSIYRSC